MDSDPNSIVDAINDLRDEIIQRHAENASIGEQQARKLDEAIRRIDDLHKAFPGGDWDGHRRFHETLIARAEAHTRFMVDLRSDLAKKGLWIVIMALSAALIRYVQGHIRMF